MATKSKNSSVIVARAKGTKALPICTLGFASLVTPDDYDPDKPMFKLNAHYGPAAIPLLRDFLQVQCVDALFEKLQAEAAENGKKVKPPQDVGEWLEGKLKEPKENSKIKLPFLVITTKATGVRRQETYTKTIGCWDHNNKLMDLKAMKLGMGSVVEPIVTPALFYSATVNLGVPTPKLYLAGVRVHKLVRYGGQQAPQETDDEAIREALNDPTFEAEDLSAFAAGATSPAAPEGDDSNEGAARSVF